MGRAPFSLGDTGAIDREQVHWSWARVESVLPVSRAVCKSGARPLQGVISKDERERVKVIRSLSSESGWQSEAIRKYELESTRKRVSVAFSYCMLASWLKAS